jgi:hypothetical protein
MKKYLKIFCVIAFTALIGLSMSSCDFFKTKDCSHCDGTGQACSKWLTTCTMCYDSYPDCYVCSGSGRVPDW